ncbi:hypothetical protein C0J52_22121, partial [Blattella germanica]
ISNVAQFIAGVIYLTHSVHYYDRYDLQENPRVLQSTVGTAIAGLILDGLLIYGIHRKKPLYMLPFLVLDLIGLVIYGALILLIPILILSWNPQAWGFGLLIFVLGSALLAFFSFLWVVLYSYFRQMEDEKNVNCGIVNYTYGIPSGHVQITTCPEDEKALCPYPTKAGVEMA